MMTATDPTVTSTDRPIDCHAGDEALAAGARQEAQRALALLSELHAELEMSRARVFLESLPQEEAAATKSHSENDAGLTKREIEVLRLVADGLNNQITLTPVCQRAHRPPPRCEYLQQAQRIFACSCRRSGSTTRSHTQMLQMPQEAQWSPAPPMLPAGSPSPERDGDLFWRRRAPAFLDSDGQYPNV
jgi:hypothetical protein